MPTSKTRRRPLRFRIEDVELCLSNAERLLQDAQKVSEATAVALTELSLEEALKGWVIYVHRSDGQRDAPRAISPIHTRISQYIVDNIGLVKRIDPRKAFIDHRPKLDALRFVAGLIRVSLESVPPEQMAAGTAQVFGPGISMAGLIDKQTIAQMAKIVDVVRESEARKLSDFKERGFYVNLTRRGQLVTPDALVLPNSKILGLYVAMVITLLKGTVMGTVGPG